MAGGSFQEVLQIAFEVLGADDARKLQDALKGVGDAGGEVDAKLSPLLDSFTELGNKSAKVAEALDIQDKIRANDQALTEAKAALASLNAEFDRTDKSSATITLAFSQAEKQVKSLGAEQLKLQNASATTNAELTKAGVDTGNLGAANDQLKSKTAALSAQITQTAAGLKASGQSAHEAAAGFAEVAEKSSLLRKVVDVVKELAAAAAGLFALEKVKDLIGDVLAEGDKAAKFGQQFRDAFGGVEQGASALEAVKTIAEQTPLALDDVNAAAIRAKKQGLDPLNGSLLGLIAANARYGGSVDDLNTLIDIFGKATAKGAITTKQLVELQSQGIPAAQLLGDAIGKSAQEVLRLADAGQLGRQSVSTLLDALSKAGSGGAADQLGTLSALTTKLRDEWDDFLQLIANSGAYDFAKQKLADLNEFIKRGLGDGSLQRAAQATSDAIVGIGRGLASVTSFIYENATAIGVAVKGYVLFKAALLTLDLAGAGARFIGLAQATAKAGDAAEAAASPTGGFGKLRARIDAIPKAIKIGVAVADVDFALTQIESLITKLNEYYLDQAKYKQDEAAAGVQRDQLAAKAGIIAQRLKGYADVQIQSAADVRLQSEAQAKAYIDQLENATRYYTALRIQAEQAGDSAGVGRATEQLRELGVALTDTKKYFAGVDEAAQKNAASIKGVIDQFLSYRGLGVQAAVAVSGAFDNIDIRTPQGLQSALDIIAKIAPLSGDARDAIQSELIGALSKLNNTDLAAFEQNITKRLKDAKGSGQDLAIALNGVVAAALQNLGLSAQQAGIGITEQGRKTIASFDAIVNAANIAGPQIQLAFAQALSTASTTGEVDALKQKLQQAFDAGKIGANEFGVAMEAAGRKTADIATAAVQSSASLDGMGKAGEDAAARISGSLQNARDALIQQQNQLAAQLSAALAADDKNLVDSLNGQIATLGAQVTEYNQKIAEIGKSAGDVGTRTADGFRQGTAGIQAAGQAQKEYVQQVGTSSKAIDELSSKTAQAGNFSAGYADAVNQMAQNIGVLGQTSEAAATKYQSLVNALFNGAGQFSDVANNDGTNIIKFAESVAQAFAMINEQINQQKKQVVDLSNVISTETDAQIQADINRQGGADRYLQSLKDQAEAAREGKTSFDLLGQADLAPLEQALDAAAQKVEQLRDQAIQAKSSIEDIGSSIQDQIDQINGNQGAVEDRRYQQQLDQINNEAELAGNLGSAAASDAIAKAEQLHSLKLKQIAEQAAAQQKADQQTAAAASSSANTQSNAGSGSGNASAGFQIAPQKQTLDINLNGANIGNVAGLSLADQRKLSELVLPQILLLIKNSARQTGIFGK